jgi:hypothetical protein
MEPGGLVQTIGLSTCRTGPPGWDLIPVLFKDFQIRALAGRYENPIPTQFQAPIDCP